MPASSRLVEGRWWNASYEGPPLVSLHQSLKGGLGVRIGDTLTFSLFGEEVRAEIASFRDYSWQGGIDFLATFSPGVLDAYPATLLGAVTAARGAEEAVERDLATRFPDIRFIAIGATLEQITAALGQERLTRIRALPAGEPFVVPEGGMVTVAVITGETPRPVDEARARPAAVQMMRNRSLSEAMRARLDSEKAKAKIEYQPGFAPPATPSTSPSTAPSAAPPAPKS